MKEKSKSKTLAGICEDKTYSMLLEWLTLHVALVYGVKKGHLSCVEKILNHVTTEEKERKKLNFTPLTKDLMVMAACNGHIEMLSMIMEKQSYDKSPWFEAILASIRVAFLARDAKTVEFLWRESGRVNYFLLPCDMRQRMKDVLTSEEAKRYFPLTLPIMTADENARPNRKRRK